MTDDRGSASVPLIAGVLLFCLTALAAADVGAMVLARARAQAAADAAALAAVVDQVPLLSQDTDPVAAADTIARANGAALVACACEVGSFVATVEVEITPRLAMLEGWMGRSVRASATARADDALASYRDG